MGEEKRTDGKNKSNRNFNLKLLSSNPTDSNKILIIDPQLLDLTNLAKRSQRDQITITNEKLTENHPIIGKIRTLGEEGEEEKTQDLQQKEHIDI